MPCGLLISAWPPLGPPCNHRQDSVAENCYPLKIIRAQPIPESHPGNDENSDGHQPRCFMGGLVIIILVLRCAPDSDSAIRTLHGDRVSPRAGGDPTPVLSQLERTRTPASYPGRGRRRWSRPSGPCSSHAPLPVGLSSRSSPAPSRGACAVSSVPTGASHASGTPRGHSRLVGARPG